MKVLVDAEALQQVLQALTGPGHLIRELQVLARLPDSPIGKLLKEYNDWVVSPPLKPYGHYAEKDGMFTMPGFYSNEAEAVPQGLEIVGWEYRWFDSNPYTVTSGKWSEWERVAPRNPHMETAADRVREIQRYINNGMGKYEIRTLYAAVPSADKEIRCKERLNNGGVCPHHNLQCGWPKCNEAAAPQQKEGA